MDISLAVETARAWLDNLAAYAPAPTTPNPVVLACAPGERHSLGLEALSVLLRYRRQSCRVLGTRVPATKVSIAVEVNRPAAVVLVAQRESGNRQCVELLHSLSHIGTTTFYAGLAFDAPTLRRGVPGTYLGISLARACDTILLGLADETADRPHKTE